MPKKESANLELRKKKRTRRSFIAPIIFAFIASILGAWFVYHGVVQTWKVREGRNWPTTTGTIVQSEMKSCGKSGQPDCHPIIVYDYEINGIVYSSTVISTTKEGYYNQVEANSLVAQFAVGSNVKVFYNPGRPESAFLIPGRFRPGYLALVLVGLFFLFSSAVVFRSWIIEGRRRRDPEK